MSQLVLLWNVDEYERLARRTAKDTGSDSMNLIHAAMGLSSDAGEFVDAIKKHVVYGKPLDYDNAIEELGDVLWFISLACKTLNTTMAQVMAANINKLSVRYPDKYSDEAAIDRADKIAEINLQVTNKVIIDPAEAFNFGMTKEQQGSN